MEGTPYMRAIMCEQRVPISKNEVPIEMGVLLFQMVMLLCFVGDHY
jgi:hypothetical protein